VVLWRISNYDTLNGIGGLKAPGRWHTQGHRVVYLSSSPAAALLEILVHFEIQPGKLPWAYKLLEIQVPDDLQIEKISQVTGLPPNWVAEQIATQQIGDNWLEKHSSPLLEVPSAIVPRTSNYLLNPHHPETSRISIVSVSQLGIDKRLLRQ
jgi:RES domain-containing protein